MLKPGRTADQQAAGHRRNFSARTLVSMRTARRSGINHPDGFAAVAKIEFDLVLKARSRFRRHYFDRNSGAPWNTPSAARDDSSPGNQLMSGMRAISVVKLIHASQNTRSPILKATAPKSYEILLSYLVRVTGL
jgi:hypothetical protein